MAAGDIPSGARAARNGADAALQLHTRNYRRRRACKAERGMAAGEGATGADHQWRNCVKKVAAQTPRVGAQSGVFRRPRLDEPRADHYTMRRIPANRLKYRNVAPQGNGSCKTLGIVPRHRALPPMTIC